MKEDLDFINIAEKISRKSPCLKTKVGALIVKNGKIRSKGINEAPPNQKNCSAIGFCYRIKNSIPSGTHPELCRAFGNHAEINAIIDAAKKGVSTNHAIMFVFGNTEICVACKASIIRAGIDRVVYKTKNGEIKFYDVNYDWSIHSLDIDRKLDDWKNNVAKNEENEEIMQSIIK